MTATSPPSFTALMLRAGKVWGERGPGLCGMPGILVRPWWLWLAGAPLTILGALARASDWTTTPRPCSISRSLCPAHLFLFPSSYFYRFLQHVKLRSLNDDPSWRGFFCSSLSARDTAATGRCGEHDDYEYDDHENGPPITRGRRVLRPACPGRRDSFRQWDGELVVVGHSFWGFVDLTDHCLFDQRRRLGTISSALDRCFSPASAINPSRRTVAITSTLF